MSDNEDAADAQEEEDDNYNNDNDNNDNDATISWDVDYIPLVVATSFLDDTPMELNFAHTIGSRRVYKKFQPPKKSSDKRRRRRRKKGKKGTYEDDEDDEEENHSEDDDNNNDKHKNNNSGSEQEQQQQQQPDQQTQQQQLQPETLSQPIIPIVDRKTIRSNARFYLLPYFNHNTFEFRKKVLFPFFDSACHKGGCHVNGSYQQKDSYVRFECFRGKMYTPKKSKNNKPITRQRRNVFTARPKDKTCRCKFVFSVYWDDDRSRWYVKQWGSGCRTHTGHGRNENIQELRESLKQPAKNASNNDNSNDNDNDNTFDVNEQPWQPSRQQQLRAATRVARAAGTTTTRTERSSPAASMNTNNNNRRNDNSNNGLPPHMRVPYLEDDGNGNTSDHDSFGSELMNYMQNHPDDDEDDDGDDEEMDNNNEDQEQVFSPPALPNGQGGPDGNDAFSSLLPMFQETCQYIRDPNQYWEMRETLQELQSNFRHRAFVELEKQVQLEEQQQQQQQQLRLRAPATATTTYASKRTRFSSNEDDDSSSDNNNGSSSRGQKRPAVPVVDHRYAKTKPTRRSTSEGSPGSVHFLY
ncbi:hypothetical protein ACA910_010966 [Epithemia clementina (nom. ined.)]